MLTVLVCSPGCWPGAFLVADLANQENEEDPPIAFSQLFPSSALNPMTLNVTFAWEDTVDETGFQIQISQQMNFTGPMAFVSPILPLDTTQYTMPPGILVDGTTYYWRVFAMNADNAILATNGPQSFVPLDRPPSSRNFGGLASDTASDFKQTSDGGFILAGTTRSFGAGSSDIFVLKLNPDQSVQWERAYGGGAEDNGYSIVELSGGGYAVSGESWSQSVGSSDFWILKLYADGNVAWEKTYGGGGSDDAYMVKETSDGGLIVVGMTSSFGPGSRTVWVLKLASNGAIDWQYSYGGADSDYGRAVVQTNDGGYIVAGNTESAGQGQEDIWVFKLDSLGNIEWEKTYGQAGRDVGNNIMQTPDLGFLVSGHRDGNPCLIKLKPTPDGEIDWQMNYTGFSSAAVSAVVPVSTGGYYLYGNLGSSNVPLTMKVDASGAFLWGFSYPTGDNPVPKTALEMPNGDFMFAASDSNLSVGSFDMRVFRTASDGTHPNTITRLFTAVDPGLIEAVTLPATTRTTTTVTGFDTFFAPVTEVTVNQLAP